MMATFSPSFLSDCTILVRACALEGVLCLLTVDGRPATEALASQREQELVLQLERVAMAAFHVCKERETERERERERERMKRRSR